MSHTTLFPRDRWVQLGIADPRTNTLIGDIGIRVAADVVTAEIGFSLDVAAQGAGLGTEAVREAIALVFEHAPVARIVATTDARNLPSVRLLERVGMRRIDTAVAMFRGEPCTEHAYEIARPAR
jgi:aminoglycoside 6'-N-acetyltransferase